ncbi:CAAX geranylgeranyltransferase alpha subunit [Actinomortierella ambigua]|uniref:Protein farnesyltransferase/geranylgeranyltransferase type-1 subunit alpha n=1 Tax=Actinomortierella ambigua TaxID=1343610 RepID=A0A9P6QG43_9FUNG|nr:CAAX geranylgeranyltransferase alpha subunit [Actinomortierella ambigua]
MSDTEASFFESQQWADVTPVPQDDGPNPLVPIAYSEEYSTAMGYLRALTQKNEISERALELTKMIIELSPSHYTVWYYRQTLLKALDKDMTEELEWNGEMAIEHLKSYQIWHHRQVVVDHLSGKLLASEGIDTSSSPAETEKKSRSPGNSVVIPPYSTLPTAFQEHLNTLVKKELDFIAEALREDSKNYHAWSYRQWVLRHFGHGPWWKNEFSYLEDLITVDVRNNSAWNQRFYIVSEGPEDLTEEVIEREIKILNKVKHPISEVKVFCETLIEQPRANFSPFVHSTLVDIYEEEAKRSRDEASTNAEALEKARASVTMLADKVDTIRAKYWNWRKSQLQLIAV